MRTDMQKLLPLLLAMVIGSLSLVCQEIKPEATEVWEPEPAIVTPGDSDEEPPSDAIILYDGSNTDAWQHSDGSAVQWTAEGNALVVKAKSGSIKSVDNFGSMQLHIEWRTPTEVIGESQGRGNSGVYIQGKYEVQILDSYDNRTYSNGQAGSIYKQAIPLANAMRGPGEWQTYDIIYQAPTFTNDSTYLTPPYVTVIHNGVVVQNHTEIKGTTEYIGAPKVVRHDDGPIMLQDHGNPTAFRNIWVRKL